MIKYRLPLRFPPFPCLRTIFGKDNQCLNNEFTLRIISSFEFNEQRKIVRHEDIWSLKDLMGSLPIIGWLYVEIARKLAGMFTGGVVIVAKEVVTAWDDWTKELINLWENDKYNGEISEDSIKGLRFSELRTNITSLFFYLNIR